MEINFKQIDLENEIIKTLNKDNTNNNTFHFKFLEDTESVRLNIISCNSNTKHIFLLIENSGDSIIDCLDKALSDIKKEKAQEYSWIVKWIDDVNNEHISYFIGKNETEVRNKFYYSDDGNIAIVDIKKMPLS